MCKFGDDMKYGLPFPLVLVVYHRGKPEKAELKSYDGSKQSINKTSPKKG